MYIKYKNYFYNIYIHNLKYKDVLFFFFNKNNKRENILNKNTNFTKLSANKNILMICLTNSIFNLIKHIISVKIGIIFLKKNNIINFSTLCNVLNNDNMFLIKVYDKIYILSQLKLLKSLNYNHNVYLYISNIKNILNLFTNFLKIKV